MAFRMNGWHSLPSHIIIDILSYLPLSSRAHAARVCSFWSQCFDDPSLWSSFKFWFYMPNQSRFLQALTRYGKHMKRVYIELDQSVPINRENACVVISKLAGLSKRRVESLKMSFQGENPYFYAGQEFVNALKELFGPLKDGCVIVNPLRNIDLSGLTVAFDDDIFNTLSANHTSIERINIQNKVLICKVSPTCALRLAQRCRKLKELQLFSCSLTEDVLMAFTEHDRVPLQHLSIFCRREEKYKDDIPAETWNGLRAVLPDLRVTLMFDHTCPLHKVSEVMKPEIPVSVLRLETYSQIYEEVQLAAGYYSASLVKLVINAPMTRNSPELNKALLELAAQCHKLQSVHVICVLEKATVDGIHALHPHLRQNNTYTLKYTAEPHPWIAGFDC